MLCFMPNFWSSYARHHKLSLLRFTELIFSHTVDSSLSFQTLEVGLSKEMAYRKDKTYLTLTLVLRPGAFGFFS